ncbi:uncharacterized protein LOC129960893 isoform X2 [Argiope bruennichi]|uniref:uncharacterized protein LOC129960893 isoform X2 n=1 Tax=Argiope bruennichi TaxID=94029 RepID=UPI0024946020|nr:uncharacterized protein LOC129960893 isoform X2 [Argiope bruennichi]
MNNIQIYFIFNKGIKNNLLFFTEMKYVQKPRLNSMDGFDFVPSLQSKEGQSAPVFRKTIRCRNYRQNICHSPRIQQRNPVIFFCFMLPNMMSMFR